jgi:hypothetical protein
MVTRFVTSPPTDNCPQPKEALPTVSQLFDFAIYNILTPRLCDLMVRRWRLIGYFLILYNPPPRDTFEPRTRARQSNCLAC